MDRAGVFDEIAFAVDVQSLRTQSLVHRLRTKLIAAARFPDATTVLVGGAPGQGVDFLHRAYEYFPPLILAVLVLTYLLLLREGSTVVRSKPSGKCRSSRFRSGRVRGEWHSRAA